MTDRFSQALSLTALGAGTFGAAFALGVVAPVPGTALAVVSVVITGLGAARAIGVGE